MIFHCFQMVMKRYRMRLRLRLRCNRIGTRCITKNVWTLFPLEPIEPVDKTPEDVILTSMMSFWLEQEVDGTKNL